MRLGEDRTARAREQRAVEIEERRAGEPLALGERWLSGGHGSVVGTALARGSAGRKRPENDRRTGGESSPSGWSPAAGGCRWDRAESREGGFALLGVCVVTIRI